MSREEVHKLLGGYATGTLTPEEQEALFAAALEDQELFDALSKEQPLRDLLRDPAAKAEVLAALDTPPARGGWLTWVRRPWVAGLAMAGLAAVGVSIWRANRPPSELETQIATRTTPAAREAAPAGAPPQSSAPTEVKQADAQSKPGVVEGTRRQAANAPAQPSAKPAKEMAAERRFEPAAPAAPASRDLKDVAAPPQPIVAADKKAEAPAQALGLQQGVGQQAGSLNSQNSQNLTPSPMVNQQFSNAGSNVGQNVQVSPRLDFRANESQAAQPGALAVELAADSRARQAKAPAPAAPLGARFMIIRAGDRSVEISTPLNAGEGVRLRIIPNGDGFVYVTEGDKPLVNGAVKNNQPFETPELKSDGAGQRQFSITLSRVPLASGVGGGGGGAHSAVSGFAVGTGQPNRLKGAELAKTAAAPQSVTIPITLTWK